MIDIKFIRENPEKVKKGCRKRNVDCDIEKILELDRKKRELLQTIEGLKAQQNKLGREGIEEGKRLKEEIKALEPQLEEVDGGLRSLLRQLPNLPFDDVPVGKDESANVVLRKWGNAPKFNFEPKDHLALGEVLDIIDVSRAAKVSGARFGYLKGDAVLLEFALVDLVMKMAIKEKFIPIVPPVLIRGGNLEELGYDMENYYLVSDERCPKCNHAISWRGEVLCEECGTKKKTEIIVSEGAERLKCHHCGELTRLTYFYLIGTAEHAIAPMHSKEIMEEKKLPRRYVGFSTAFRREAGTYGEDTRGILRVHQFDKVELFSICTPETSEEEHKFLVALEEKLWQALEIPYQVVQLSTGDMSWPAASTIDIEAWMPGQNRYREVSSASNTTDFQSSPGRLNIRYKKKDGKLEFVHMLNATGFAIGRTIIAILENYQKKDGSIEIPKVLQKYMGKKIIEK